MGCIRHKLSIFVVVFLALLIVSPIVSAEHSLVNSRDWRDVYSTMLYGELGGTNARFLTSTNHAQLILNTIPLSEEIFIYSSQSNPFVSNYENLISAEGYAGVDETISDSLNLLFADKLTNINKFIVIDDSYGYNAIAAAPYATLAGYYVIFADTGNINAVNSLLESRTVEDIILFGQLDADVKEILSKYNPIIINEGDRFENNMAMVDLYLTVKPTKQVILTNGEFIEKGLLTGDDPVLFIGKSNVPTKIRNYIDDSDFEVAILIGNELIGTATFIRRQIGISVFVKFAQGARSPEGPISEVEDLDRFPMPIYTLSLGIDSATYNSATNTLEVTYQNNVDLATFFTSTITITPDNITLNDDNAIFIDGENFKTVLYDNNGDGLILESINSQAEITTFYGESPNSLENTLIKTIDINRVTILDDSEMEIIDLVYKPSVQRFFVKIRNIGPVDSYVRPELLNVIVNDEPVTRSADSAEFIPKGQTAEIVIKLKLSEADILDNKQVTVRGFYGVRENALVKIVTAEFPMKLASVDYTTYAVLLAILIILIVIVFTKKECKVCKQRNPIHKSKCARCKHPFGKRKR